jgi:kinesin family protein 6/9
MSKDDSSAGIEVILRICPSDNPSGYIAFDDIEENAVIFQVPKTEDTIVNNSRTRYGFRFNDILQEKATQNDAFRIIGAPAVRNVLQGFNSTVFAYGQTGSGKTYTITGGPERYSDRGIIPRAISMLFAGFQEQQNDTTYCAYISYLELYNETGYDLLVDESTVAKSKGDESLKVTMLEDDIGNYHFRNLSVNPVSSEEEALNFLFLGDTNRAIGETEMNLSSSRSHCIFTILVEARKRGSDTVIRSKLNLVDLAGSERVHKTNSTGQTLREAQHINASLFYLEMVIVALYERSKKGKESTHIPYRNSMMTSVLRDSLGGNCKTIMVATISPEAKQTDESISTCHFAQRVALIKNNAQINEELEPELVIQRLKSEVKRLREEIRYLKGENGEGDELSKDQTTELEEAIALYLKGDGNSQLNIGTMTLTKIQAAFGVFRDIIWNKGSEGNSGETTIVPSEIKDQREMNKTIEKLQCDLKERNEEIEVLVQMVKEGKGIGKGGGLNIPSHEEKVEQGILDAVNETTKKKSMNDRKVRGVERCVDADILNEPAKAFQWFQDRYPGVQAIEENKKLLNGKYLEVDLILHLFHC